MSDDEYTLVLSDGKIRKVRKLYGYNIAFKQMLPIYYTDGYNVVYDDLLKPFSKMLKTRIKEHNQNTILIEGRTGSGKSTIGVQLCHMLDKRFTLANDYVYSTGDLKRKLRNKDSSPVSLLDEGSVSLNSYNSLKTEDKNLTILMDAWRQLGKSTVICMPNRNDLNKRVRQNHIDYLIKCPVKSPVPNKKPRGFCTIYRHQYRDWADDWWLPMGTTRFSKLDRETQKEYNNIKLQHLTDLLEDYIEEDDE